jgi:serine protease Do
MATRKSSIFYGTLIGLSSLVVGMVLASRLDLSSASFAGPTAANMPAANSAPITGPIDATTFRTIAHDASPSVVSITVTGKREVPDQAEELFGFQLPAPFGNRRQGGNQQPPEEVFQGAGSGFIIDKAGFILTNNHVVQGADEIRVVFADAGVGEEGVPAKVVGRDVLTDSALIQLTEAPKQALTEAKFGDSNQIAPGDWVMAIGNPFRFSNTVTVGVVSAVGRVDPELNPVGGRDLPYIQTDAAINRGNSGGPLLNIRGEVVGINTAIITGETIRGFGGEGGNIGIGFAVPINTIRDILPQLRTGKVIRGRIGVLVDKRPITANDAKDLGLPSTGGALITSLEDSGPAKAAGLEPGDVIVEFNGQPIKNSNDLVSVVSATPPGTSAPVRLLRNGKSMTLSVKVEELNGAPEEPRASSNNNRPSAPSVAPKDTGFGMMVAPVNPRVSRALPGGRGGAVVTEVDPTGSAARSLIFPNDVILKINGKDVTSLDEVTNALSTVPAGQAARVLVWRPNPQGQGGNETFVMLRKH